jgi:hypothetical protein
VTDYAASTQAQWRVGVDYPKSFVCSGPKYQYPYFEDGVHLNAEGYQMMGEKYGQVYFERVLLGKPWQPLQPTEVRRRGRSISLSFHVPVPPLAWDTRLEDPHPMISEWSLGKGFEVTDAHGKRIAIESVAITGPDGVVLNCFSDPGPGARVSYAMVGEKAKRFKPVDGTSRWGLLRDSDPFVGTTTKDPQPNYCVAFELKAP